MNKGAHEALQRRLAVAMKKPKKKFADASQKFHYVRAAQHWNAYRHHMANDEQSGKHVDAFKLHARAGNFTEWHRDQLQHDAKHMGMPPTDKYEPYRKKKRGHLRLVKAINLVKARIASRQDQFHEGNGLAADAQKKRRNKWKRSLKKHETMGDSSSSVRLSYDCKRKRKKRVRKMFGPMMGEGTTGD